MVHKPLQGGLSPEVGGRQTESRRGGDGVMVLQALVPKLLLCQRKEKYLFNI